MAASARSPAEEGLAEDADHLDKRNRWKWMSCFPGENQTHEHHRNKPIAVTRDAPVAVVEDSKVAGSEADTVRIDMMSQTKRGRRGRAGWDQGIRNRRCLIRGDHPLADDPGMDVRTMSEVGERLQDGNVRRYGDACDSLDLWDEEPVGGAHGHRKPDLDKDVLEKASRSRVEAEADN